MDVRAAEGWLAHVAVGGGLLLLAARVAVALTRQPARRQRLGEWGILAALVLAALSLAPAWLPLPLPAAPAPAAGVLAVASVDRSLPSDDGVAPAVPVLPPGEAPAFDNTPPAAVEAVARVPAEAVAPVPAPVPLPAAGPGVAAGEVLFGVYVAGAAFVLGRHLFGHFALARLLRRTRPAPPRVEALLAGLAAGRRRPRLRIADRVRVPFSCGIVRPTVVLPAEFTEGAPEAALRWVLAHELAHVERRDARGGLLVALGQVVYYPFPWLWSLCRQVRLCQEYVADAAAVAAAGSPEDYAQFLLGWAAVPPLPAGVAGVAGRPSDLYRRVTMLLKSPTPVERRCPRHWAVLTGGGLLVLAVLGAGVGRPVTAAPAPDPNQARTDEKKEEPRKDEPKKDAKKHRVPALPELPPGMDLEDLLRGSGLSRDQVRALLGGLAGDDNLKELMDERQRILQQLQGLLGNRAGALGLPGGVGGGLALPGPRGTGRGPEPRLGVSVSKPGPTLAEQLDLPRDQGLTLEEVRPGSAAAKAGMKRHDILLELDGNPVPSDLGEFAKQLAALPAQKPIPAVVLRRGKRETLKELTLPEAKAARAGARLGAGVPGGLLAAPGGIGFGAGGFGGVPQALPGLPGAGLGPATFPRIGGAGFNAAAGGPGEAGVMTTTFRTGDRFTTRHQEGSLVITLTGKVEDGRAKVGEIQVQDGRETRKYDALEKVPEAYRDKARHLADLVERDGVRIRMRGAEGEK
jgi:beta-lactamase regulating signal transducer with metallopeptidase domain